MKLYGFLVVSRKNRWRASIPGDGPSKWFDTKRGAETAAEEWKKNTAHPRDEIFREAFEKSSRAREEFIGECTVEIVTVPNSEPFQVDFKKPTITFPDGTTMQFSEDTPQADIDDYIETRALNEFPKPRRADFDVTPEINESGAWGAELFVDGDRRALPDIETWSHFFPMADVVAILNSLGQEGWSVAHVSEDRGLYASDVVQNMSAPVTARYLLVSDTMTN